MTGYEITDFGGNVSPLNPKMNKCLAERVKELEFLLTEDNFPAPPQTKIGCTFSLLSSDPPVNNALQNSWIRYKRSTPALTPWNLLAVDIGKALIIQAAVNRGALKAVLTQDHFHQAPHPGSL